MTVILKIGLFVLMVGGVSYWLLSKLRIRKPQPAVNASAEENGENVDEPAAEAAPEDKTTGD